MKGCEKVQLFLRNDSHKLEIVNYYIHYSILTLCTLLSIVQFCLQYEGDKNISVKRPFKGDNLDFLCNAELLTVYTLY